MNIFLYYLICNRYFWFYYLFCGGIHSSGFFIFLLNKLRVKNIYIQIKKNKILFWIIVIILWGFSSEIVNILVNFFDKMAFYRRYTSQGSLFGVIFRFLNMGIFLYYDKKIKIYKYKKCLIIYSIGFLIYFLLFDLYLFSTRINMFIRILEIYLYSEIFFSIKDLRKKIILFFILSSFMLGSYYKDISNEYNSPYKINPIFLQLK